MIKPIFILLLFSFMFIQPISASSIGYSGMEQIKHNAYLVVIDTKGHKEGNRIGILKTKKKGKLKFTPLEIKDWKHADGRSSDLESVCRLPGKSNEYLLAESGSWEGVYGRIFHIKLTDKKVSVLNVYNTPNIVGSREGVDGDNYEGMICLEKNNTVFVIVGERGGSSLYKAGYLRIGILDYDTSSLSWKKYANDSIKVEPPGDWRNTKSKRSIGDLYLDQEGIIWAAATDDPGDKGPFKTVIYKAAKISSKPTGAPIIAIKSKKPHWIIDGFKVEALAGPSSVIPGSFMSIGTEDEDFGGVWRPLFKSVE